ISSSPPQYVSTAPVYVQQPVYVEPAYYSYPPRTYYPSYSYDPIWPLLGVGLAIGAVTHWGWHGGYYRGGYSHVGGHWRR
ncbi:MAG: hypothetical protein HY053_07500, partial [Proteobacteria bacterium]|nr:hypothetical protein [Pseudomonadota bacterium]